MTDKPLSLKTQQVVDEACDRFEQILRTENPLTIESVLDDVDEQYRSALFEELLRAEIQVRKERSEDPVAADYLRRFTEYASMIETVFDETIISAAQIASPQRVPTSSRSPSTPHRIGNYKLLQPIGEGGMGTVWMAEQEKPVRRRVALKIVKSGMDSREVLLRFEAERQSLAMMDHPGIARILDTGTTEQGQPFFAMELVKGVPLTTYCDTNKLGLKERLNLFVQICRAIQHAHQKGIAHRDLKPGNILVTLYDGAPIAKVIDFGLAKALHDATPLTMKTLFTQHGQVMGTLAYMSPEQAEMNSLDVDTRTDVYSLGVIFYELLTGSTPISMERIQNEAFDRILAVIRTEEATKPSSRLSDSGGKVTWISSQTKTEPKRLSMILKGELDWIALKALEKNRTRRYDGPAALADDVQRYLDDEVVQATPPSFVYRVRKTVRKYKAGFATAAALALLLIAGLVTTATLWIRATAAEGRYKQEFINARAAETKEREARINAESQQDRAQKAERFALEAKDKAESDAARTNYILAEARWNQGRAGEANKLLDAIPKPFRNIEWSLARRRFQGSDMRLQGLQTPIDARYSPDGKLIIVEGYAGNSWSTLIWDATTGLEHVPEFEIAKSEEILRLSCSEGTSKLVYQIGSLDEQECILEPLTTRVVIWDSTLGRSVAEMASPESGIVGCVISDDGERICTWDSTGGISVLDASTCEQIWSVKADFPLCEQVKFAQDCLNLVAVSRTRTKQSRSVQAWDVDSGRLAWERGEAVQAVWFGPQGNHIAAWINDTLQLWATNDGETVWLDNNQCFGLGGLWPNVALDPEDRNLAIGNSLGITVLDVQTGKTEKTGNGITQWAGSGIASLRFSPDGRSIAIAGFDHSIRIWDKETNEAGITFFGHLDAVHSLAFSPDGSRLLSSSADGTVQVWDAKTGMPSRVLVKASPRFDEGLELNEGNSIVSPDGAMIAIDSNSRCVLLDLVSGAELRTLGKDVKSVAFSKDRKRIATVFEVNAASENNQFGLKEYNTRMGDLLKTYLADPTEHSSKSVHYIIGPDFERVALCDDGGVRVWNRQTNEVKAMPNAADSSSESLTFSPDGETIATQASVSDAGAKGLVNRWNASTGKVVSTICDDSVRCIAYSHNGSWIATAGDAQRISIWDADTGKAIRVLAGHSMSIDDIAFTSDNQRLVSIDRQGVVKIWDTLSGEELTSFHGINTDPRPLQGQIVEELAGVRCQIEFSAANQQLIISYGGDVVIWDGLGITSERVLDSQSRLVRSATFNHDGTLVAAGDDIGRVRIFDAVTGTEIQMFDNQKGAIDCVTFSPSGKYIASSSLDGTIYVQDTQKCNQLTVFDRDVHHLGGTALNSLNFSSDEKQITSTIRKPPMFDVWDTESGKRLLSPSMRVGNYLSDENVQLSFDGQRLVAWDEFEQAVLFDTSNGSEIQRLGIESIHRLCLSPDGESVAFTDYEGPIYLFSLKTGNQIASIVFPKTVDSLSFNSDGKSLCAATSGSVFVWDVPDGSLSRELRVAPISQSHVDDLDAIPEMFDEAPIKLWNALFSPDGKAIVAVAGGTKEQPGKTMVLWNEDRSINLEGHTDSIDAVAFNRDGTKVISGSRDRTLRIWDSRTGDPVRTIEGQGGNVIQLTSNGNEQQVLSMNHLGQLRAWDLDTATEVVTLRRDFGIDEPGGLARESVGFSGNGLVCAMPVPKTHIQRWDLKTGEQLTADDEDREHTPFVFESDASRRRSPNGRYSLLNSQNGLKLIDNGIINSPSEKAYRRFKAKPKLWWHTARAEKAEFSKDWYPAAYHRGWILKSKPESPEAHHYYARAHERLGATDRESALKLSKWLDVEVDKVLAKRFEYPPESPAPPVPE